MIVEQTLYDLAKCRFDEAKILLKNHKADGAVYLCGYALELILKRKIVLVLDWDGYPNNNNEFQDYKSFRSHDLNVLLKLAGLEKKIQADTTALARWQIANVWNSEIRYREVGKVTEAEASDIIEATRLTINFVFKQT